MKTVYLVQHGIAHVKDVDEKKSLSDAGIKDVRKVAEYLKKHEVCINKICHSRKLRAFQTAEIFSEILEVNNICTLDGMNPNDKPAKLIQQMNEDHVMYVGHLPNMQYVVSEIVVNNENIAVLKFQNSAVVCIELENNVGSIKWFITPVMC